MKNKLPKIKPNVSQARRYTQNKQQQNYRQNLEDINVFSAQKISTSEASSVRSDGPNELEVGISNILIKNRSDCVIGTGSGSNESFEELQTDVFSSGTHLGKLTNCKENSLTGNSNVNAEAFQFIKKKNPSLFSHGRKFTDSSPEKAEDLKTISTEGNQFCSNLSQNRILFKSMIPLSEDATVSEVMSLEDISPDATSSMSKKISNSMVFLTSPADASTCTISSSLKSETVTLKVCTLKNLPQDLTPTADDLHGSTHEKRWREREKTWIILNKDAEEKNDLIMRDFIYWNPSINPMKNENDQDVGDEIMEEDNLNEKKEDTLDEDFVEAPQVQVGPDGSIIINQQSLIIHAEKPKLKMEQVREVENVTYSSFRKKRTVKPWKCTETLKFYQALSVLGTDFELMTPLFPGRTRKELKSKFKNEDKKNPEMISKAVTLSIPITKDIFNQKNEDQGKEKRKENGKLKKRTNLAKRKTTQKSLPADQKNVDQDIEKNK